MKIWRKSLILSEIKPPHKGSWLKELPRDPMRHSSNGGKTMYIRISSLFLWLAGSYLFFRIGLEWEFFAEKLAGLI
jgi:hypothetical protein